MSNESNDGPLAQLSKLLGLDYELAPIAAVKRIEVTPRRLNIPEHYSDDQINNLVEKGELPEPTPTSVAELLFHTNKRRKMQFDRIPVGHDTGYRCFDPSKHDSESAFQSGEFGDGMTEDEAYVAWLCCIDEPEPEPKAGYVVHSSPFEPPTVIDVVNRSEDDDVTFDDDLEPQ
jgi:hypothetical protein